MIFLNPLTTIKKILISLSIVITMSACTNYFGARFPVNGYMELVFDNLQWQPTSCSLIAKMDLPYVIKDLSATDIISVKISKGGYETKASSFQHNAGNNTYWYEVVNDRIELFRSVESNSYDKTIPKIIVTIKG